MIHITLKHLKTIIRPTVYNLSTDISQIQVVELVTGQSLVLTISLPICFSNIGWFLV